MKHAGHRRRTFIFGIRYYSHVHQHRQGQGQRQRQGQGQAYSGVFSNDLIDTWDLTFYLGLHVSEMEMRLAETLSLTVFVRDEEVGLEEFRITITNDKFIIIYHYHITTHYSFRAMIMIRDSGFDEAEAEGPFHF